MVLPLAPGYPESLLLASQAPIGLCRRLTTRTSEIILPGPAASGALEEEGLSTILDPVGAST